MGSATYQHIELTHSIEAPPREFLEGGRNRRGEGRQTFADSKAVYPEVRANIDHELVDRSIDFMRRQKAAGKPFFLYLPFSMGHFPNLPPNSSRANRASATMATS